MCCSRSTSWRCCSRSGAPAISRRWPADVTDKLVRRHPHVFGDVEAETSGEVRRNWDQIKQREPGREAGVFGEVPENLPGAAVRAQGAAPRRHQRVRLPRRRGAAPVGAGRARPSSRPPAPRTSGSTSSATFCSRSSTWRANSRSTPSSRCARRPTGSGPGFEAGGELAASEGHSWNDLAPDEQLAYYARARLTEGGPDPNEPDRARTCPTDPRQPRKPDRRGRAERAIRGMGTRRGPVGRLDRRVRGHRAARRRLGLERQGREPRGRERQRRDRHRGARPGRLESGRARPDADHLGRNAEQVAARRERDPGGVARRRPRRRGRGAAAAVALPRRRERPRPPGSDDERDQRRGACRQRDRLPGVHDRPGRRLELSRRAPDGRRGVPQPEEDAPRHGSVDDGRRRGRVRAEPRVQRGGARGAGRGDPGVGLRPGRPGRDRARPGGLGAVQGRVLRARARGPDADRRTAGGLLGRAHRTSTRSSRSRTGWARRTGRDGRF